MWNPFTQWDAPPTLTNTIEKNVRRFSAPKSHQHGTSWFTTTTTVKHRITSYNYVYTPNASGIGTGPLGSWNQHRFYRTLLYGFGLGHRTRFPWAPSRSVRLPCLSRISRWLMRKNGFIPLHNIATFSAPEKVQEVCLFHQSLRKIYRTNGG